MAYIYHHVQLKVPGGRVVNRLKEIFGKVSLKQVKNAHAKCKSWIVLANRIIIMNTARESTQSFNLPEQI